MGRLSGRVAVVTGAAVGMGAAHARLLAEEGASVAVCDLNAAEGEALAETIGGAFFRLDVASEVGWKSTLDAVAARLGRVTILVNNAGTSRIASVEDETEQEWNRVMAVNATGPFLGIKTVAPQMKAAGGGVIVNISSTAGINGAKSMVSYTASKWAIRGLTKAAALDLAPYGIRVVSLHPALVRTQMSSRLDIAAATAGYPIPRPGEPDEIARMLRFIVLDATFSTGCEFIADGGSLLL